jgi:putative transposase
VSERRALVQPDDRDLSVRQQCELLRLARSSLYYVATNVSAEESALMKAIDRIYTKWPFYGSRKIVLELRQLGHDVNRKRVQRLMQVMGLQGLVPGPHTSKPHPDHRIYPYLLRRMDITRPNQVWAADITYIPLESGWAYLIAIIDWHSRAVLAWELSNTMTVDFCVEALEDALRHHGTPEIFNTDQGAQFTSPAFTGTLAREGVTISMDGKGRATDNIFIERLWRSLKYEDVFLHDYATPADAKAGIGRWLRFYNHRRPHQGLENHTPMEVYRGLHEISRSAA